MHVPTRWRSVTVAALLCLVATTNTPSHAAELRIDGVSGTVFQGDRVYMRYYMHPGGQHISEIHWPLAISFSNGNTMGPIPGDATIRFSSSTLRYFEHVVFDTAYGLAATDPDTIHWYAVAGDSSGWTFGGVSLAIIEFVPTDTGWIHIDTASLPAGSGPVLIDLDGQEVAYTWQPESVYVAPPGVHLTATASIHGDTLMAGVPGRIDFEAKASGVYLSDFTFALQYHFSNGNIIGPLDELTSLIPGYGNVMFDTTIWHAQYDNPTDPDTTVYQLQSTSGAYLRSQLRLWSLAFTPTDTGTITVDGVMVPGGESLRALDTMGNPVHVTWQPTTLYVIAEQRPVIEIATSSGCDTLQVGEPGEIVFRVLADDWNLSGVGVTTDFVFSNGNLIEPLYRDPAPTGSEFRYSAYAESVFERTWPTTGYAPSFTSDTATLTWGARDLNGNGWDSAAECCCVRFLPRDTGTITIDTSHAGTYILDRDGQPLPFVWNGPLEVTIVGTPYPVRIHFDAFCPRTPPLTYDRGGVAAQAHAEVLHGLLVSFDLVEIKRDGIPTVPAVAPTVTGLNLQEVPDADSLILFWSPVPGEAGIWEFVFEARNDLGDTDSNSVTFTIAAPDPVDEMRWGSELVTFRPELGPFDYRINLDFVTTDHTQGVVGPFYVTALTGAGLNAQITTADAGFSADMAPFEQQSPQNPVFSFDGTRDSIMMGLIDFGGDDLAPGDYPGAYYMDVQMRPAEGLLHIDSTFLAPASGPIFNQTTVATIYPSLSQGCFAFVIARNEPPTVSCLIESTGPIVFGDSVVIPGFTYDDPDDGPGPYAFFLSSMMKSGLPTSPTHMPVFDGDTFIWMTSDVDTADVGLWEFCVKVNDGKDDSKNECCFTVEVINQVPLVCFEIGSGEAPTGSDICVPLSVTNLAGALDGSCVELGGFDLLFTYDPTLMTFTGLDLDESVLEASGWEYVTYRLTGSTVRVVAIADMNNSNQHPSDFCIDGLLAQLCFRTRNDQDNGCQSSPIRFTWGDCGDNTASSRSGDTLWIITDPGGPAPWYGGAPLDDPPVPGGGIIDNSDSIQHQLASFDGTTTGPAAYPCATQDTSKPTPAPFLYFVNGKIKITCPGDLDDRGDLNLNGLAYEIADAVLYSNFFIYGPIVFVAPWPPEAYYAASDVNADGTPLTVADLVYLIRVITGNAEPIAGDLLGGGPKVATVAGKIDVMFAAQGARASVTVNSEHALGAGLFTFHYSGTEIAGISATGRASDMDVKYRAEQGELRVLIYNIEEPTIIEAGTGEILAVVTTGGGELALIDVEAATFEGGMLECNVSAKVLPTAYALHQNYPNPFNPSTSMAIDFPNASQYTLTIYNIAGQVVKTYEGQAEAGTYTIAWDGHDNRGSQVASGVYFYSLRAGDFVDVRKMVLMR